MTSVSSSHPSDKPGSLQTLPVAGTLPGYRGLGTLPGDSQSEARLASLGCAAPPTGAADWTLGPWRELSSRQPVPLRAKFPAFLMD